MSAVTWDTLAKNLDDAQTILTYIASQLAIHNADDSAHGQSNEAIYNHRIAEILDHLDGSITNAKILASHRTYAAVVGPDAEDDFDNIQDAIDYVNGIGGGTIFIKAGTYIPPSNLILYSNITLEGADDDSTIIDFNLGEYCIQIIGISGTHKKNINFRNLRITGSQKTNSGAITATYVDYLNIENCYFYNQYVDPYGNMSDILTTYCTRFRASNNRHYNSTICYDIQNSNDSVIQNNSIDTVQTFGIYLQACTDINIVSNHIINLTTEFVYDDSGSDHVVISDNYISSSSGGALYLSNMSYCKIINNHILGVDQNAHAIQVDVIVRCIFANNYIYNWNLSGIYFTGGGSGCDRNVFTGNIINSMDRYGIEITNSNANNNCIVANILANNGLGAVLDSGTGTVKEHNIES